MFIRISFFVIITSNRLPFTDIYFLQLEAHQYNLYQSKERKISMKNNTCLGCRTYFEEGEKVPLESMVIQFKNYFLPIKESKQKYILLKTITGFLNSKGGTIYIGVEDTKGVVQGQKISRKEQDEFMLFIKFFVEKIRPAVDLVNKEQVTIVYVPVVTNKVFKGKYIIKIIVKQGDPSKTYHFSNVISLEMKGKTEEIEVFHAFYRHNMGGIAEIRGEALLEEVARKAEKPNEVAGFHKFCNPDPLKLDGPITKIGFSGIKKDELRNKLEEIFHKHMENFDVDYELTYDMENHVLLLELEDEKKFKEINESMKAHLEILNKTGEFNFVQKGQYLDFFLYKNLSGDHLVEKQKKEISPDNKEKSPKPVQPFKKEVQVKPEANEEQVWDYVAGDSQKQDPPLSGPPKKSENLGEKAANPQEKQLCEKALGEEFVLTITHIYTEKRQALEVYLKELMKNNQIQANFEKYIHTIELKFQSRKKVMEFYDLLQKNNEKLSSFGVRSNIVVGINMKLIHISHYDRNKRKDLKQYITNKIGADLEQVDFKKSNNKFFLEIKLKSRELTCSWLDKLLLDGEMKQFMMPGQKSGKLHIYIYCICN